MADRLIHHFFGGFVRMHILYHAAKEPVWGSELMEELGRHGYRLRPGTVYPILHQMESHGYLNSKTTFVNGRQRRYYRTTAAGRALLRTARKKLRELVAEILDDQDAMHPSKGNSNETRKRTKPGL